MKTRILTQTERPHQANQLHDQFIAAGIVPVRVESTETETRFAFNDAASDTLINGVILAHVPSLVAPTDIRAAWQAYRAGITNATTVPQIKVVLTNELGVLLKELFKSRIGDLQ